METSNTTLERCYDCTMEKAGVTQDINKVEETKTRFAGRCL